MNEELLSLYIQNWDDVATTSLKALSDLLNANLAIHRVRELANELNDYDWKSNEASYTLSGHLIATQILEALDGEQ